ncbi:MAG: hypothetical protein NTZ87_00155 [Candidatus Nomurabacteria bacterium]|nr:hypothetical protein [Candidatus Nomurabacteria bacterium]
MPPQNNVPIPPSPQPSFNPDSLTKNPKFMETVKTFAIYGSIVYVVNALIGMLISTMSWSACYRVFDVTALVMALIAGAIGSAIGGAVFFFLYDPIHDWVKRNSFLSRYIHDMFTLFWKPFLVGTVISAVFGLLAILGLGTTMLAVTAGYAAASFGGLFIGWVIAFAVHIAVYYWYSKTISAKLSQYYLW